MPGRVRTQEQIFTYITLVFPDVNVREQVVVVPLDVRRYIWRNNRSIVFVGISLNFVIVDDKFAWVQVFAHVHKKLGGRLKDDVSP